jgi:tetratricopeptide (TPR) repeat protein
MNEHPTAAALDLFSRGGCTPRERERVMHHLLPGCESCSSALRMSGRPARPLSDALDAALDHAFSRVRQEMPARDQAFALFSLLLATPAERRLALVAEAPERVAAGLCRLLIEEVRLATNADPQRMLHLSRLAAAVADRLETAPDASDAAESRILSDLRGEAWSHLANSLRVTGRLREAERAFTTAERLLAAGTRAPTLWAEVLRRKASLSSHQRKFKQAIALTAEAAEIFRDLGLSGDVAGCLVKQAIFTGYGGRPEEALDLLAEILASIPQNSDLARQAIQAAARFSLDAGRPEEGLALLVEHRQMMEKAAPVALLRLSWLHGELAHALRLYRASEVYLLEARKGFSALEMPYEVALVCLELAAVYGETGRQEELRGLAAEMLPIFESLRVKRETLASVILLQRAEIDSALPLVGRISAQLRRREPSFPGFN